MYKLIIFDLDGTLVNSIYDLADAVNNSLAEMGFPIHKTDKFYRFVGDGTLKLAERALPKNERSEDNINKLHSLFSEKYNKCCLNKTKAYDGINQLITDLKSNGIKCAVASNKPDKFSKHIVHNIFGENTFDLIMGKCDGVPTKPAPDIVYNILSELKINKDETIFAGDSDVDVITAHNSGLKCIGCVWGFRGEEELKNAGADFLADKPTEIINIAK